MGWGRGGGGLQVWGGGRAVSTHCYNRGEVPVPTQDLVADTGITTGTVFNFFPGASGAGTFFYFSLNINIYILVPCFTVSKREKSMIKPKAMNGMKKLSELQDEVCKIVLTCKLKRGYGKK